MSSLKDIFLDINVKDAHYLQQFWKFRKWQSREWLREDNCTGAAVFRNKYRMVSDHQKLKWHNGVVGITAEISTCTSNFRINICKLHWFSM